jgi:hypothetical protein
MKTVAIIAILLVAASAGTINEWVSSTTKLYEQDSCYQNVLKGELETLKAQVSEYKISQSFDLHTEILARTNKIQSLYNDCNLSTIVGADSLQILGEIFLLGSNCFKDLGSLLLIVDTVLLDPSDVIGDIFSLIFIVALYNQSNQECTAWIQFIKEVITP